MPQDEAPFFYSKRRINVPASYERDDFLVEGNNVQQWGPVERGADCSKFGKGFFRAKYDWETQRLKEWEDRSVKFHAHDIQRGFEIQRQSRRMGYDIITGAPQENSYISQSRFHPSGRRITVDKVSQEVSELEATQRMRDTSLRYHRPPSATLNNYDRQHRHRVLLESGLMDLEKKRTSSVVRYGNEKIPSIGVAEALSQSNYGGIRTANILDYAKHEKRTYASIVDEVSKTSRDPLSSTTMVETSSSYSPTRLSRAQTASGRLRNDTTFHLYKENIKKINSLESTVNRGEAALNMHATLRPNTAIGLSCISNRTRVVVEPLQRKEDHSPIGHSSTANQQSPYALLDVDAAASRTRPSTSPGILRSLHSNEFVRSRNFPYYQRVDPQQQAPTGTWSNSEQDIINPNDALFLSRRSDEVVAAMRPTSRELTILRREITPQGKSGILDRTIWDVSLSAEDIHRRQYALQRHPNRVFDTTSQPQILPVVPDREARGARELQEVLRSRPQRPIDRPPSFTLTATMLKESRKLTRKQEDIEAVKRLPLNVLD